MTPSPHAPRPASAPDAAGDNGALRPTRQEAWAWLTETPNHLEFLDALLDFLEAHPREAAWCLYEPAIQARCALVKRDSHALFKGRLWAAVKLVRGVEIFEWDGELDILLHAHERLRTVPLASIEPEDVAWLWEPYIPFGKLTLVEGDPEAGKTYLMMAIAAAVTRGYHLPDQTGYVAPPMQAPGNVLYLTAEDGLADTIRKRAAYCGADLERIFVVPDAAMFPDDLQPFSLARPHLLSGAIAERQARLVILDPLTAFLGGEMDMHRANEVRPIMSVLGVMAATHHCAMVAIRHWTKQMGARARYRGQGNIDFLAAARSVLAVGESPEDERLRIMAPAKNSLAPKGISMVFQITNEGLLWAGTSTMSADELSAAQPHRHKKQRENAMLWLRAYLQPGPQAIQDVTNAAEKRGISSKQLRMAREHLGLLATKEGETWYWRLPTFAKWDRMGGDESRFPEA